MAHVDFAETALTQMLLKLESVDAHAVIKIFPERVKHRFLVEQVLHVVISHLDATHCEKTYFTLQFRALVVLILEFLEQPLFYFPEFIVPRCQNLAPVLRLAVRKELNCVGLIMNLISLLYVFKKLIHFYLL